MNDGVLHARVLRGVLDRTSTGACHLFMRRQEAVSTSERVLHLLAAMHGYEAVCFQLGGFFFRFLGQEGQFCRSIHVGG